jgi:dTDP-4-amino-4,6-dideoxygalactose transaminase
MFSIPLIRPYLPPGTKERVNAVLDSGYLTEGPVTRELEAAAAAFLGTRHALAVTSATTGIEVALRALKIGPDDEVIVPDYTYPATALAVGIVGATAVIVDVDPDTMLIDYDRIEGAITPRTRAIVPVSEFGNPLDYDRLNAIRQKHELHIVEDAACAFGAAWHGRRVGTWADISVFSLHPRKFITSGEGGIITTDNREWAEWMESYKHFGMGLAESRPTASFERPGTNYKLCNILAAVALGQMQQADALLNRRRTLAANYVRMLCGRSAVKLPRATPGGVHSYQTFAVFVTDRDAAMQALRAGGIEAQIGAYALHLQPVFRKEPLYRLCGPFDGSRYAFEHCLALPLYHEIREEEQAQVVDALLRCCV